MAQSKLLVHPADGADGVGHGITPRNAGWRYVGFETTDAEARVSRELDTGDEKSASSWCRERPG